MASTIQTMREGGTQHPEEIVNLFLNSVCEDRGGVFDRENDGLKVVPTAPATMDIEVEEGFCVVSSDSHEMAYPVRVYDGNYSLTVSGNSSGNPRIDVVVLYIDTDASANATVTNVAKLDIVEGTAGASPVAPSDSDITTALGSSYPYIILAEITVANGASSITAGNITDVRGKPTIDTKKARIDDYQITYSIATDHLTIEVKDGDGKSFSSSNVGYFKVGNELLSASSALTLELEDTSDFNILASGNEFDLFVFAINNNSSLEIGVCLNPVEKKITAPYTDAVGNTAGTNGALIVMSGTRNATNSMRNIGSIRVKQMTDYDWEAPSTDKIINEPCFFSDEFDFFVSAGVGVSALGTYTAKAKINNDIMHLTVSFSTNCTGSGITRSFDTPILFETTQLYPCGIYDNGAWLASNGYFKMATTSQMYFEYDWSDGVIGSFTNNGSFRTKFTAQLSILTRS